MKFQLASGDGSWLHVQLEWWAVERVGWCGGCPPHSLNIFFPWLLERAQHQAPSNKSILGAQNVQRFMFISLSLFFFSSNSTRMNVVDQVLCELAVRGSTFRRLPLERQPVGITFSLDAVREILAFFHS